MQVGSRVRAPTSTDPASYEWPWRNSTAPRPGFQGNSKTRPYQDPTCFPLSADAADAGKARGKEDDLESVDDHEDQVENIHDHDLAVNWMLWFHMVSELVQYWQRQKR